MKNRILIIALFLPLLSFAQQQGFVVPFEEGISLNLPYGVDIYSMENKYDTLFISLSLGRHIYNQEISFNTENSISEIKIEQQVEYCLTISDEGPHIDLRNWLVGYTPWLSVPQSGDKYQLWANYEEKPKAEKPEFDVNSSDFIKAIEAEGFDGEIWQNAALQPHSLNWFDSKLNLKVSWVDFRGRSQQKIIIFELPMGC